MTSLRSHSPNMRTTLNLNILNGCIVDGACQTARSRDVSARLHLTELVCSLIVYKMIIQDGRRTPRHPGTFITNMISHQWPQMSWPPSQTMKWQLDERLCQRLVTHALFLFDTFVEVFRVNKCDKYYVNFAWMLWKRSPLINCFVAFICHGRVLLTWFTFNPNMAM